MMVATWIALLALFTLIVLPLMGLIVLCINKRTRVVGLVLLGLSGCLCLAGVAVFWFVAVPRRFESNYSHSNYSHPIPMHVNGMPPTVALPQHGFQTYMELDSQSGGIDSDGITLDDGAHADARPADSEQATLESTASADVPDSAEAEKESGLAPEPGEPPAASTVIAATADTGPNPEPAVSDLTSPGPTKAPPPWLDQASGWTNGNYHMVLVSDPCLSVEECERQLNEKLLQVTGQFIYDQFCQQFAYYPEEWYIRGLIRGMRLTPSYIREKIARQSYVENHYSESLGREMKRVHLLVEFDKDARESLQNKWREYESQREAREAAEIQIIVCAIVLALLAFLGLIYGFLKFDTATKGYYTKRVLIGGIVAAILIALLIAIGSSV